MNLSPRHRYWVLVFTVFFAASIFVGCGPRGTDGETDTKVTGEETETILLPGDVPLEMVRIPVGTFLMGRYPGEQDSRDSEDPRHEVTIGYDFWMGKYTVTKRQWTAVMRTNPWAGQIWVLDDPDSPAVYVSWNDAQDFIAALNAHIVTTGQGVGNVRLPSEAEWEYACRAGTTTRFYWGDDPDYTQLNDYAWHRGNREGTYAHVVGQKLPNAWGFYDMSGNVWEWCEDNWHGNYNGAPADGSAWVDSPRGSNPLFRGGGWSTPSLCRSAYRNFIDHPSATSYLSGFRLAR